MKPITPFKFLILLHENGFLENLIKAAANMEDSQNKKSGGAVLCGCKLDGEYQHVLSVGDIPVEKIGKYSHYAAYVKAAALKNAWYVLSSDEQEPLTTFDLNEKGIRLEDEKGEYIVVPGGGSMLHDIIFTCSGFSPEIDDAVVYVLQIMYDWIQSLGYTIDTACSRFEEDPTVVTRFGLKSQSGTREKLCDQVLSRGQLTELFDEYNKLPLL